MDNQIRCISHEIRNQISICELYSRILKKNLEKLNIKNESVDNALFCITKSLKVINNNLLDLKSLDSFSMSRYDLRQILKDALNLSIVYVQEKDIEITLSCEKTADICVDEDKFLACLVNLIKNAVEAIDEKGYIKIFAEIISNNVFINIANNGEPISKEVQTKIFEEGFTTKKTGSGLGLPICSKNLKLMNADLKLKKSDNEETEFEIVLPVYKP